MSMTPAILGISWNCFPLFGHKQRSDKNNTNKPVSFQQVISESNLLYVSAHISCSEALTPQTLHFKFFRDSLRNQIKHNTIGVHGTAIRTGLEYF